MEKAKREFEAELAEKKHQIEVLEDAIQLAENARSRFEVNLQSVKIEFEKTLHRKEIESEEKRRGLSNQVSKFLLSTWTFFPKKDYCSF